MTVTTIAHRGDPVHERENTRRAFSAAVACGVDWVELDLRRTRDGEIVVLHDQTLERLWGRAASVGDLDLAEVAALGEGGLGIPTLRDVLTHVEVPLMVDFTRREVVAGAVDVVRSAGAMARALFVTGNVAALHMVRERAPEARIGVTWMEGHEAPLALLEELDAEYWNPMQAFVSAAGVAAVHEAGRKVSVWTVDTEEGMARMAAAGVDAIVSNRVADLVGFARGLPG